ncbi:MAG TPA: D-2-hydroxyacid dehydrogenase [Pyrinomonadaceae bacterium]|nr:D-2-hydroxyacid dehydrogenase [Pyrinomonadaceae bacterium]
MEKIVFLERNSVKAGFRRPAFAHEWREYEETRPDQVAERLRGATIIIGNKLPLREAELSALPALKLIAVAATGVDNVDLEYCRRRKIAVCNVRNYARRAVPEHVLMLILALRRNLISYREDVINGEWQEASQFCLRNHTIRDLYGSTLGIIGYGALGQAVEKLASCLGMRVLISEHKGSGMIRPGRSPFEEILRQCDVISLHCPLTFETRNMIGAAELEAMRPGALLINTARGGLVDEAALAKALRSGTIAGAGFDVLSEEPPRKGNPLLDLSLPNFILTPHVAWASDEAMQALADQVVDNLEAFVSGSPQNLVT